jgi:CubicO group peptidase (beta-lactamase class C family)
MEKQQFRVLYRQFLFRMVDLEVLSSNALGDSNKLLGQFASLLIFVSIILSMGALGGPPTPGGMILHGWSMEHVNIASTMLVVGLFAVLSWDSTFPNRGDVLVLAPLPVRPRTLFLAKVAAVGTAMSLTVVSLQAIAGLAYPLGLGTQSRPDFAVPALNLLPAVPPVSAAALEPLLQRDLAPGLSRETGVAIGVVKHGERRVYTFGAAKPDSIYQIGSISKTFTSLLLAQMVVEGRVRLDEPLRELVPSGTVTKPAGHEIKMLDLAIHRSGLPPIPPNLNPQNLVYPEGRYRASDLWAVLGRIGVARAINPSPIYSNFGYSVLGESLALRAGLSFPELVAAKIGGPFGLRDTTTDLTEEQEERLIPGYNSEHHKVPNWYMGGLNGAAGLRSTAPDMLAYLEANLHETTPALRLQHELHDNVAPGAKIALGWIYNEDTGTYFHNGVISGYTNYAMFNPKGDYAVVVLVNQAPSLVVFADVIAQHIQQRLTGKPAIALGTVTVPGGGFFGLLRFFAVYWLVMLGGGAFIFCCVLGLQGIAAEMLPRRLFLRASSFLQLAAFCVIVCVYFMEPLFVTGSNLMEANGDGLLSWSPSYWFLGLFQQLNGSPALAPLARRAWIGLAIAVSGTAVAYALSYFRTLRKIVEEPDILPGGRRVSWLPPFGSRLHTALVQFTIRTLARSRQHRIVLAFYLGIGFALTILILKSPTVEHQLPDAPASDVKSELLAPLLAASIVMLCFSIIGTRIVFAMPKDLRANWIFRICRSDDHLLSSVQAAQRRSLVFLSAAPVWLATAAIAFYQWPIQAVVGHLLVLALLASILSDICIYSLHKIPFTCSYLPGKSRVHMAFLAAVGLLWSITMSVRYEREALENFPSMAPMLAGLLVIAVAARWLVASNAAGVEVRFEEEEVPAVQVLGLR